MSTFTLAVPIRFGDCDPAGILYYPRYFDLFHQAMEAWFADALGLPYRDVLDVQRLGLPSVHAEADYRSPTTYGETVQVELGLDHIGRSSLRFAYRVVGPDGGERAVGHTICVLMDLDPDAPTFRQAVPLTDDLRRRFEAFATA